MTRLGFDSRKLHAQLDNIKSMLEELPLDFQAPPEGSGCMSFLRMCMNKDDEQWGEHQNCDELLVLGLATGMCSMPMRREVWASLPGSVPYVAVDTRSPTCDLQP